MSTNKLGKYLTLEEFCTCTQTYHKFAEKIDPFPKNPETITAIYSLNKYIIEPIIDYFTLENFKLTYGFCSPNLRKYLDQKDPITGIKNGRIYPKIDQHMGHEINRNGKYYCERLGAAYDFLIVNVPSNQVIEWILQTKLPFDSIYFYGNNRPIHISYGPQHKRDIWTFNSQGMPTRKGLRDWLKLSKF